MTGTRLESERRRRIEKLQQAKETREIQNALLEEGSEKNPGFA